MPRTLSHGCTGKDVRALQRLLNFHLYRPLWTPPLAVDGIFGPKTNARVLEFQKRNGLTVDGLVGPNTRRTLLDSRAFSFHATIAPHDEAPPVQTARLNRGRGPVFAQVATPTGQPSGPQTLAQRTVQLQAGQQLSLEPFFFSPLVVTGQVNWLFRRNGLPDTTITAGGQFAFNQQTGQKPSGGWTGQGFVQWGPSGLLKIGDFDLVNPFVAVMLQQNQGQPPSIGLGLGNQVTWTIWSLPHPSIPGLDRRNIGLFVNGQLVTNTFLPLGTPPNGSPPAGQFSNGAQVLFGATWTMDWTPRP
jgi:peptidoglycan hydrolase-like protein with peptidoglycan-binding domain